MSNFYSSQRPTKGKEIRQLLMVIGSGVLIALLFTLGMLYYYNPSGVYLARNVLLAPDSASTMRFSEGETRRGGSDRFILDDVVFSYFDVVARKVNKLHVDMKRYQDFYDAVASDRSVENPTDEMMGIFNGLKVASIEMNVRSESEQTVRASSKIFLTVNFSENGDYYRVQLRMQSAHAQWAYFYHPGIYQKTVKIFIPQE